MQSCKKQFHYGRHQVTLETGEIARQASGAVICAMGDTTVLVTVVARREAVDPDIPALLGASAALAVSGIPFNGPSARLAWATATGSICSTRPPGSWATPLSTWWWPAPKRRC